MILRQLGKRSRLLPRALAVCAAVALAALAIARPVGADEVEERRLSAGVKFFRTLIAADVDLPKKTVAPNQLLVVFVYHDNRRRAVALSTQFLDDAKERGIRNIGVTAEISADPTLAAFLNTQIAALFIAEPLGKAGLAPLVRYGIEHHVIVYSPFEGDVERGVLGGLSVEAQVRPYINQTTLNASHITLKSFFLEIAKVYE